MVKQDILLTNIETFDEAQDFMSWLGERRDGCIAIDTETEGFHWWRDRIRLVQIGDAYHGWSMQWDRWSGLVEEALSRYDGRVVMHNFKFDTEFMRHYGIFPDTMKIDDTRTMAHLIDPTRLTGLKPLSDAMLGPGMSLGQGQLGQMMKSHKWDWKTVPYDLPIYWQYAALDTVLTARIYDEMLPLLAPYRDIYDMEMAAQIAIMDMEMRGARVDLEYAERKAAELREWADATRDWTRERYGESFNIGSNQQVAKVLIDDGWEPTVFTPSGQPKMAKEVIERIDHPLAKLIIDLKHAEKMASAYFDNFIDLEHGGFLHSKINPLGTRTGRMSVTDPALQTLPRDALVRDAFIPREGNKLLLIDYDQMEVRLGAHFFQDARMIDDILTQDDVHTHVASQIYGVLPGEVTKVQRQTTKNAVYAILYGSGIATFAKTAGISEPEAKSFMHGYNDLYPGINRFKKQLERESHGNQMDDGRVFVKTPYGRLQPAELDGSYRLLNYLVQGTGADVLKHKIAQLSAAGLDEYMILPVHDEMIFDVPEDLAEDVLHEACEIMTVNDQFRVPLTVDGKIVDRWGDAYRKDK